MPVSATYIPIANIAQQVTPMHIDKKNKQQKSGTSPH